MEIKVLDLVFPDLFLPPQGLDFYRTHGMDEIVKKNQMVKIMHRCQHLIGRNECDLEGPAKPDLCKEWVCRRHLHDSQWHKERIGEFAVDTIGKIKSIMEGADGLVDMFQLKDIRKTIVEFEETSAKLLEGGMKDG
jgi:hypothetical protein